MTLPTAPSATNASKRSDSFGIVIVFYRPTAANVAHANQLAALGWKVVVIDNTPLEAQPCVNLPQAQLVCAVELIGNRTNVGIAAALNQGVHVLIGQGYDGAILFDQDSTPSKNLLVGLASEAKSIMAHDASVALVGPAYQDIRLSKPAPFVRFQAFKAKKIVPIGIVPIEVDFLITSGSCVNLRLWEQIGSMDEALFIDSVDLEWCMRARAKGYRLMGIPWLVLPHALGGQPVMIFGRAYPTHSALRHYYMCRNVLALCRRAYVPWTWKSIELIKMPLRLAVYAVYFKPRLTHLRMACKGLYDGARGRLGKISEN